MIQYNSYYLPAITLFIFLETILGGLLSYLMSKRHLKFFSYETFAMGIFVGLSALMLLEVNQSKHVDFNKYTVTYVIILTFVCISAIDFLLCKISNMSQGIFELIFAIFSLSLHSFFAGFGLGSINDITILVTLSIAIIAHKGIISFALMLKIRSYTRKNNILTAILFLFFCIIFPIGVLTGYRFQNLDTDIFDLLVHAFAIGVFLYLGVLHFIMILLKDKNDKIIKIYSAVLGFILIFAIISILHVY